MLTISFRPIVVRFIFLLLLAAGFGALGWIIVRAAMGDIYQTFVQRSARLSTEGKIEAADLAVKYSPQDPLIRWLRGGVYFNAANEDLMEERLDVALNELRQAAQMSPEDYRVWLSLGRVLDRTGSIAEARAALEKALQLAPNHFETRWALGNHLLRAGDRDASFAQMRLALANRPSALPLVFDYAWNVYQGDGKAIAKALDPPIVVKAQMVSLLISRGRVEDGLSIWSEMNSPRPKDVQRVTESLVNVGRFAAAYGIWSTANIPDRPSPDAHSLLANSSFEEKFSPGSKTPFYAWGITPSGGLRVTLDRKETLAGEQSLRVGLNVEENSAITIATQTVPVKPNKRYCLSFFVKTEEMESLSTPFVEIYDSA
ncbi:MAG: tetratricopeptide repeat protein, partial [Acidobacteria bacterium]|nr:tetratricopeptide repeat protein [Acidobacteriota bacterium]